MTKTAANKTKIQKKIEELEKQSLVIREELENDLDFSKEKILLAGKIALGISAGLIFSAIIIKGLFDKKEQSNKVLAKKGSGRVYQRFRNQLMHQLSAQATGFLLGIARERFKSYISKHAHVDDEDSDNTG